MFSSGTAVIQAAPEYTCGPVSVRITSGMVSTRTGLPSVSVPLRRMPPWLVSCPTIARSAEVVRTTPGESADTQAVPSGLTSCE